MRIGGFLPCCGGIGKKIEQLDQMTELVACIGDEDEGGDNQYTKNELDAQTVGNPNKNKPNRFSTSKLLFPWRQQPSKRNGEQHSPSEESKTIVVKNDLNNAGNSQIQHCDDEVKDYQFQDHKLGDGGFKVSDLNNGENKDEATNLTRKEEIESSIINRRTEFIENRASRKITHFIKNGNQHFRHMGHEHYKSENFTEPVITTYVSEAKNHNREYAHYFSRLTGKHHNGIKIFKRDTFEISNIGKQHAEIAGNPGGFKKVSRIMKKFNYKETIELIEYQKEDQSRFRLGANEIQRVLCLNGLDPYFFVAFPYNHEGKQYWFAQYAGASSLRQLIKQNQGTGQIGSLPEVTVSSFSELIQALEWLHLIGYVILDIKPENIVYRLKTGEIKMVFIDINASFGKLELGKYRGSFGTRLYECKELRDMIRGLEEKIECLKVEIFEETQNKIQKEVKVDETKQKIEQERLELPNKISKLSEANANRRRAFSDSQVNALRQSCDSLSTEVSCHTKKIDELNEKIAYCSEQIFACLKWCDNFALTLVILEVSGAYEIYPGELKQVRNAFDSSFGVDGTNQQQRAKRNNWDNQNKIKVQSFMCKHVYPEYYESFMNLLEHPSKFMESIFVQIESGNKPELSLSEMLIGINPDMSSKFIRAEHKNTSYDDSSSGGLSDDSSIIYAFDHVQSSFSKASNGGGNVDNSRTRSAPYEKTHPSDEILSDDTVGSDGIESGSNDSAFDINADEQLVASNA